MITFLGFSATFRDHEDGIFLPLKASDIKLSERKHSKLRPTSSFTVFIPF